MRKKEPLEVMQDLLIIRNEIRKFLSDLSEKHSTYPEVAIFALCESMLLLSVEQEEESEHLLKDRLHQDALKAISTILDLRSVMPEMKQLSGWKESVKND